MDLPPESVRLAYSPDLFRACAERFTELLAAHLARIEARQGPVLNWQEPPENVALAAETLRHFVAVGDSYVGTATSPRSDATEPGSASEIGPEGHAASRPCEGAGVANGSPESTCGLQSETERRLADRFAELVRTALARGHNLQHPRYMGHQVPASVPLAGLFDAIGSVTNQVMAIYEMGPWATAVEAALVREIAGRIGFENAAGLVTHGGSLANLTALLTARNVCLGDVWRRGLGSAGPEGAGRPVLVVHSDAHYSIARAAGVLGLGSASVVRVPLDERRRMCPAALERCLSHQRSRGRRVVAVCACACATPIGAFDPLVEIAEVCRRHGVWLHVDAAHGGGAVFSRKHRHLLAGLDQADSVVCDAHKMLFVPALCAFVFYRNPAHRFAAFEQDAPYLFDPSAPGLAEYDSGLKTVECTKRAAAFGLWGLWSLFGPSLFEKLVDRTFALGRGLYERLCVADDFEPVHQPQCNIVAFRWLPRRLQDASADLVNRVQREIRHRLIRSGRFYIVQTELNGLAVLRVTLINPLTTTDDLDALLDAIRETGHAIVADL